MTPHSSQLLSEEKYRLLVEAIADYAIFLLDAEGQVISWNAGAEQIHGYAFDEIVNRHFALLYIPDDRQNQLPAHALSIAQTEGRFENEGWRVRKDGSQFWANVLIDAIRDEQQTLLGYATVTRDLTEKKIAEDSLRKSQEQFRLLVRGVTDYAIYMLDETGLVSSWNFGAERIKGYKPNEIIGQHFSTFYTEEDRLAGEPGRNLALAANEGRVEKEGWRIRKDGTRFWAHVIIDRIADDDGRTLGFAKITRDVTSQRDAADELERAREALFQSQKTEAIGKLTGGVAHDFNNLLMIIQSCLEMIEIKRQQPTETVKLVGHAKEAVKRGAALTQRMLAFARKQELRMETIDVEALISNMTDLLQRSLGPQIHIATNFPLALDKVSTDTNQLELALMNLAVNARDAMQEGGNLTLSARNVDIDRTHSTKLAPGKYVCLSVTDEGAGMDEATVAKATEPFFTTKGVGKGTGLGLSMVHGLLEQSGGRLVIKSSTHVGTRIELWLPAALAQADRYVAAKPVAEVPAMVSREGLRILVVDDDALVRLTTSAMLESVGHRVLAVESAEEALEWLEREPEIDLLLTDHAMPGMTGAQLTTLANVRWPHLPIVLASGFAEIDTDLSDGATRLAKPYGYSGLIGAINRALAMRSSDSL